MRNSFSSRRKANNISAFGKNVQVRLQVGIKPEINILDEKLLKGGLRSKQQR